MKEKAATFVAAFVSKKGLVTPAATAAMSSPAAIATPAATTATARSAASARTSTAASTIAASISATLGAAVSSGLRSNVDAVEIGLVAFFEIGATFEREVLPVAIDA